MGRCVCWAKLIQTKERTERLDEGALGKECKGVKRWLGKGRGSRWERLLHAPSIHQSRLGWGLRAQCQPWGGGAVGLAEEGELLARVARLPGPWEPSEGVLGPAWGWLHGVDPSPVRLDRGLEGPGPEWTPPGVQ